MAMLANVGFYLKASRTTLDDKTRENIIIDEFYDNIEDLKYQNNIQLRILENRNLSMQFSSSDNAARLEMDGFDAINNEALNHEDGTYLEGRGNYTYIFDGNLFPLPPGMYVLTVYEYGKKYYTGFEVVSPVLDDRNLWVSMLDDIMANMPFAAVDYAYIRSSAQNITYHDVSPNLLWKMLILNQEYNNVMSALHDLKINPHNKLIKQHRLVNVLKQGVVDNKATRLSQSKYHSGNKKYIVEKSLSFKLSENALIKKMLVELNHLITDCLNSAQDDYEKIAYDIKHVRYDSEKSKPEYLRMVKAYSFLENHCKNVIAMKKAVQEVLTTPWLKELAVFEAGVVSVQSFSDPRYNVIYSLFSKLDKIHRGFAEDKKLTMLWKRSSILYEYWNVIEVSQNLTNLGFVLESTANAIQEAGIIRITRLDSKDCLVFTSKDKNITIKMYYEPEIPSVGLYKTANPGVNPSDAIKTVQGMTHKYTMPLYTSSTKNRPDLVMNFYSHETGESKDLYLGSLIMDFKYKKRRTVWCDAETYIDSKIKYNYQFISYKNEMRTIFMGDCTGIGTDVSNHYFKPVHEVWAVYPDTENANNVEFKPASDIRIISNIPGGNACLEKQLDLFIRRLYPNI